LFTLIVLFLIRGFLHFEIKILLGIHLESPVKKYILLFISLKHNLRKALYF